MKSKLIAFLSVVLITLLMLNPETVHIALLIDGVGLEVIFILMQLQLVAVYGYVLKKYIRPLLKIISGFRPYSFYIPHWSSILKQPSLVGFALPSVAAGMSLLVLSCMLSFI